MLRHLLLCSLLASLLVLSAQGSDNLDDTDFKNVDLTIQTPGCKKEYLEKNPNHTACLRLFSSIDWATDFRYPVLDYINNYRSRLALGEVANFPQAANMFRLQWDEDLTTCAFMHAIYLATVPNYPLHDRPQDRATSRFPVTGQSICRQMFVLDFFSFAWPTTFRIWFAEAASFPTAFISTYRKQKGQAENFTQMIWASTRFIGCHRWFNHSDEKVQYYVCNYAPAGNVEGQPVYLAGRPCSRCPSGTVCTAGLCNAAGKSPWPSSPEYDEDDDQRSAAPPLPAVKCLVTVGIAFILVLKVSCRK